MNKVSSFIISIFLIGSIILPMVVSYTNNTGKYVVQWEKNFGSDWAGGRFQGSQPIGDCDNDGENELLIGGRDGALRIMKWNEDKQDYEETAVLHSPFYIYFLLRKMLTGEPLPAPGGFAIGDITGDGKNEIAATWYSAIYKYIDGKYRLIGLNPWIFNHHGGSGECVIGDCDNDGRNEVILCGGGGLPSNPVPEIVMFKWNGFQLVKTAVYDNPVYGYAYIAGIGDTDYDGENEIVCGISNFRSPGIEGNKVVVLDWDKSTNSFIPTVIQKTYSYRYGPFGGWCADSDGDGKNEIHIGYLAPRLCVFKWNGSSYNLIFDREWENEGMMIEGVNIGDVDNDGIPEICAGTNIIHILQWNGTTYIEEAVINQTYGDLAVINVGDCDNDGRNEINAAPVFVDKGKDYIYWIFKYVDE